jgi:hypothetical protein
MPNVLTTAGSLTCPSQGSAVLSSSAKLTVDGAPVLLAGEASSWTIGGCKNTSTPCTDVTAITAGQAAKLTVNGSAVVLEGAAGTTNGTDAVCNAVAAGQTRLTAV